MIYAAGGIFSKQAAQSEFMSVRYCICYAIVLAFLIIYAVIWQYILKYLPLTTAIAHKSVTVFWGFLYGNVIFSGKDNIMQYYRGSIDHDRHWTGK